MRSHVQYRLAVAAMLLGLHFSAKAQKGFFMEQKSGLKQESPVEAGKFKTYTINIEGLRQYLSATPATAGRTLEIPLPGGGTELFVLHESQVMAPLVAAEHPELKTYSGKSSLHPGYQIKVTLSPSGFNAMILGAKGDAILFEKSEGTDGKALYKSYRSEDMSPVKHTGHGCGSLLDKQLSGLPAGEQQRSGRTRAKFSNGGSFKQFRLAIAATGEYTTAFGGGNANAAYATIVAYVNEINAVYETELGVTFQLVSGTSLVYSNPATDPYTANDQSTMLGENQANLDAVIGNSNYDIGHVFGFGGSGSGGGLASSPSVCNNSGKGSGASDIGDEQSYARVFSIQLIAHEMGHQFGMSHSYNSNIPVCTTREYLTSVEPGSGATIMSYGFTCSNTNPSDGAVGNDDYSDDYDGTGKKTGPFLNFHVASISQAIDYIATLSCYTTIPTGNNTPVVGLMNTAYTIPKATPFALTGNATDADGDALSYSWEGTNISDLEDDPGTPWPTPPLALDSTILGDPAHPPFFRSYAPVASGTRTYPLLSAILNGTNYAKGDKLPSVAMTTTHTLTVRDNAGGTSTEDVTVTIDQSGPFLLVNDPSGNHSGGSSLNVAWSVNGTDQSPVGCTLVDILLSTDGGHTFPVTLATAVPNSGTATVNLPMVSSTQARLKVMPSSSLAAGNVPNIFFDISNEDFSISTPLPARLLSFDAVLTRGNNAQLNWKTADERLFSGFDIEMSRNGVDFEQKGYVAGKAGSAGIKHYEYLLSDLQEGKYFFRLKLKDSDGQYSYSPVRDLTIRNSSAIAIYPNPSAHEITVEGLIPGSSILIADVNGRICKKLDNTAATMLIDLSPWAEGLYFISITDPSGNSTHHKIIKAK